MENEQKSGMQAKMQPKEPMILSSKKKWFWIGIVVTILSPLGGLIYGLALYREKSYKKESGIIITLAIILMVLIFIGKMWLNQHSFIIEEKYLPKSTILPIAK